MLPNVVIGRGSVVAAGSVVTTSVPPMTLVQGNPAKPVAQVGKAPQSGGEFSRIFVQPEALETKCPRGPCNRRCHPGTLSVSPVSGMNLLDFPLPSNLPRPVDDGAAAHLTDMQMPEISLSSTAGREVMLSDLNAAWTVIYCYPMTGVPGKPLPEGWDMIPGARGCTPQTCGFRDQHGAFTELKVAVFGLSTQTTGYQREMAGRLHVPFEVLSDAEFRLTDRLRLPTFTVDGMRLL